MKKFAIVTVPLFGETHMKRWEEILFIGTMLLVTALTIILAFIPVTEWQQHSVLWLTWEITIAIACVELIISGIRARRRIEQMVNKLCSKSTSKSESTDSDC